MRSDPLEPIPVAAGLVLAAMVWAALACGGSGPREATGVSNPDAEAGMKTNILLA